MTEECMDGYAFVYIKGKVDPRMISTAYQKYGVMILNIVDEDKNTAVYSYDKKKISGDSILQILHYSQFANKARCLNKSESNYLLRP